MLVLVLSRSPDNPCILYLYEKPISQLKICCICRMLVKLHNYIHLLVSFSIQCHTFSFLCNFKLDLNVVVNFRLGGFIYLFFLQK